MRTSRTRIVRARATFSPLASYLSTLGFTSVASRLSALSVASLTRCLSAASLASLAGCLTSRLATFGSARVAGLSALGPAGIASLTGITRTRVALSAAGVATRTEASVTATDTSQTRFGITGPATAAFGGTGSASFRTDTRKLSYGPAQLDVEIEFVPGPCLVRA